jgi:GNAT superfamily N-acetyltransferase
MLHRNQRGLIVPPSHPMHPFLSPQNAAPTDANLGHRVHPCPLDEWTLDGAEVAAFCGRTLPFTHYHLQPIQDQGQQYELALDFDFDDEDDDAQYDEDVEINPLYGIPFGVCMLTVRDHQTGEPAGFITFRRDIHRRGTALDYDLKIFVFAVREDLRGQGYASALALGAVQALRKDLDESAPTQLNLRFIGEGKSAGGRALLNRTAANISLMHRDLFSNYQNMDCCIATNII